MNLEVCMYEYMCPCITYAHFNPITDDKKEYVIFIDIGYGTTTVTLTEYQKNSLDIKFNQYDNKTGGRDLDIDLFNDLINLINKTYNENVIKNKDNYNIIMSYVDEIKKMACYETDVLYIIYIGIY